MFNSDFRICKENYNAFSDMYPSWVIEAANLFTLAKGYDVSNLVGGPQYRIPVHDALHFYTGIETTPQGENCIATLEYYLKDWELYHPKELEEALLCWERVPTDYKDFFIAFYKECPIMEVDIDFYDYFEEYRSFLWEEDRELYNSLFSK